MLKLKINKDKIIEFKQEKGGIIINNKLIDLDIKSISSNRFHILKGNKSYNVEVIKNNYEAKTLSIKVNDKIVEIEIKDKFDTLLEKMGISQVAGIKTDEIKAPMPGLILDIKILEGEEVNTGDTILILEAMKMENILKSPRNGIIKSIKVKKGEIVEKNQILIQF